MKVSDPTDLVDLTMCRFKHGGSLDDLWCLWELGKLVGGHGQVGTWGLVDVVAVNTEKFIIEVAVELAWSSLRVKLSLGHHKGSIVCSALHRPPRFPLPTRGYRC